MASKVWPNWSFSRTFFIYDHEIVKKEEDDPKLALVYFYPPSPAVSEDAQCLFSGQVMAMVSFMKTLVNSKPRLYCLKKMKIATVHEGRFTMAMASSFNTPDGIAIRKLENLHSVFKFYQGSIQRILQEYSEDRDAFVSHINKLMPFFLSFMRYHDDKVRETFQDIPMILLPKKSHLIHLKASHLLQWIKRRPKLLAGCIIYKHKVLCTQLTPPITRYLLAVKSKKQLPAVAAPLSFQLPVGVEILMVYLNDSEHSAFGKSKPSETEAKSSERDTSAAQGEVDLKEPRSGDRSGEEEALRTGRESQKTKQKQDEKLSGTSSDVNSAIDLEHCKVENHKDWKSETKSNHDFQLQNAKVGDFPSSKEALPVVHRPAENIKSKDTVEIKSILKSPRKKSNVKGPMRTAEDGSEIVTKVTDTPRKEDIDTEGDEIGGKEQNSAEDEASKEALTSDLVAGQRNLSLNEEDEKSLTKENISRCSTTSEQILDGINYSLAIDKKEGHPTPVESVAINKNCSEELQSVLMSPVDAVVNALPNGDVVTHSNRRKKVSISALGEPTLRDGVATEQETDVSSTSEEFVNISIEGVASMQEEYGNSSFTEWPPMGQRSISSASFASSYRTSMFTDDGRSRSETDDSEDVCSLRAQRTTQEKSQKKMPGMVAVSLYTQIHSEDLMVVFIAENTLRTDEPEIKKIHQTIQSQSADLEKELERSYEVETPDPLRGVCNSVSFDTFEHTLSTKFDASIPSDDGKFFHAARLLHNEFSKDTDLQKVHLGSATATVIADQDFGNQKFQYFASADCGLSLTKGATTKDHVKTPVKDPWGLL